ncbi:MAG: PD-(D/E)XK nuclease family protein [Nitrososphaeria archaeon]
MNLVDEELQKAGVEILSRTYKQERWLVYRCKKYGREFTVHVFNKLSAMHNGDRLDTGVDEQVYEELIKAPDDYVVFSDYTNKQVYGAKVRDLVVSAQRPDPRAWVPSSNTWIVRFWVDQMKPLSELFGLNAQTLADMVKESIRTHNQEDALLHPIRIGVYHPSEIGYCMRKQYYAYVVGGAGFDDETLVIFEIGNAIHEMVGNMLGVPAEEREVEISLQVENGVELRGRADIIMVRNGETHIIELKSTSHDYAVPKPEHVVQLQIYLEALHVQHGILLYINKTNGKVSGFDIFYDEAKVAEIKKRVLTLHDYIINKILPPAEGKSKQVWEECRYCPYKQRCDRDEGATP